MSLTDILAFNVAGKKLALPLADIRRVAPLPLLSAQVGAPYFAEGFFDYQGAPVAVVRLDRLLGLGDEPLGLYTPLLILKSEDPAIAFHVGRTNAILKLPASRFQPIGEDESLNDCVAGRISEAGETIYLLSTERLLLNEERARLAAHKAMMQRRLDELDKDPGHASRR